MDKDDDVSVLLEGLDDTNISSILEKWNEITLITKKLEQLEEMLKMKVKAFLKEREWDRYKDDRTKISVSITSLKKQSVDMTQLKAMLTDAQFAQVVKMTTYEKMQIMTSEARERLKQYATKTKL